MNENIKTSKEIIEEIIEYFKENEDEWNECIESLDDYNGYLVDDRYWSMDNLSDFMQGMDVVDILNKAFFGYDEDSYNTLADGSKEYGQFNPNREYFHFDGYANLVSSDYKDYSAFLDYYAIEQMNDHRAYINFSSELEDLFNELDEAIAEGR